MASVSSNFIISLVIFFNLSFISASVTCKDDKGKTVDWFVVYKLPKIKSSSHATVRAGLGYYYLDVNHQQWSFGSRSLNDTGHAVYYTLQQVYDNYRSQDHMYVLYNDETPEKKESDSHGHTKGVVSFDESSGFWLVHSVPRYPPYANSSYSYPHSGEDYAQTFLCVTYNYETLNVIGKQLLYNYPQIYDYALPKAFTADNPNVVHSVVKGGHVESPPWNHMAVLRSQKGQEFKSFAKYNSFDEDLYHAWLAPSLGSDMLVETWQQGAKYNFLHSNCSGSYKVWNIVDMTIEDTTFKETKDHAKWAVTVDSQWICIGDINRQKSQEKRAGGTVCSVLPDVWSAFKTAVVERENCSSIGKI